VNLTLFNTKSKYLTRPSARGNKSNSPNPPTSAPTPFVSIPKLTQADRELLNAHEGCYKCRGFYAGHKGSDCPIGFPDPASYKPLTETTAQAAKKKQGNNDAKNMIHVRLGAVGGRIVAEVLIGLLLGDPHSFLSQWPTWKPSFAEKGRFGMPQLIKAAGL